MFIPFTLISRAFQYFLALNQGPTAPLGNASVQGVSDANGITESFLGIPFADAPRFNLPQPRQNYSGTIDATSYGPGCIQHKVLKTAELWFQLLMAGKIPTPAVQEEECLSINIIRPANMPENAKLPVLFWIYGGGFLIGDSESWDEMGKLVVNQSLQTNEPVIFVSFNYRLSAYGFLGGSEAKEGGVGNIGLRDQREALKWVHNYIEGFGGDPGKVTLWGQSAGGMAAVLQMMANNGNAAGLFHAVFSQSGPPLPVAEMENGQASFDTLVNKLNCTGTAEEKLACIRTAPLNDVITAVDNTNSFFARTSLALVWSPRVDGDFLPGRPFDLVENNQVANVPLVLSNVDDEGTLFAYPLLNQLSNATTFRNWVKEIWIPNATEAEVDELLNKHYIDSDPAGSPFDMGQSNLKDKQLKRRAAFIGDMVFQAPRRFFASKQSQAGNKNIWVYLSKQRKQTPILGSGHGSDAKFEAPSHFPLLPYVAKFANHYNPNIGGEPEWPVYNHENPFLLELPKGPTVDDFPAPVISPDRHREAPMAYLIEMAKKYPL